jgi:hypothetical protein
MSATNQFYAITQYGTFLITINDDIFVDPKTRETKKRGILLSVGGKKTKCVFINIPNTGDTAKLTNLKTKDGGCEVNDKFISGQDTIGMVNLAFTFVREINTKIKYIWLEDESDFPCELSNGRMVGISMTLYQLIFYQASYYETRFGAYLTNPDLRKMYNERKKGFDEKPPEDFQFHNRDLEEILRPIYSESSSWKEFFQKIHHIPNVCEVLFPWYKYAMSIIFKNVSFERQEWLINLYQNPKVFPVKYEKKTALQGGRRKTRRADASKYKYDIYNSNIYYEHLDYDVIYNLKYK